MDLRQALYTPPPGVFLADLTRAATITTAAAPDGALLAAEGDQVPAGRISAVITVFGEPDSYGRIIERGAFDEALDQHGYPLVVWSHIWDDTPIGVTVELREDGDALIAVGDLFIANGQDPGSEVANDVYRALARRGGDGRPGLRDVSIGANVLESPRVEARQDGGEYFYFSKLDLVEWGPCLRGAHPLTKVTSARAAGAGSSGGSAPASHAAASGQAEQPPTTEPEGAGEPAAHEDDAAQLAAAREARAEARVRLAELAL